MTVQTDVAQRDQPPPIEPGGPYASTASAAVGYVPKPVRGFVGEAGGMGSLLVRVLWSAVRHPRGYWDDVVTELNFIFKNCWLAIGVALFGFLLTLCIPSVQFVKLAGVTEYFGPLLLTASLRTFTVWVTALLVAGVVGAAMTAELGARKVREELDALQVMGIDPIRTLVVPRIVAISIGTCLTSIPAALSTMLSIKAAASFVGGLNQAEFDVFLWSNMSPVEIGSMLVNSLLAGILVGTICCYKGLRAQGGAIGLGRAVNQAVVTSFIALFILQLAYNAIVFVIFPDMGTFR